MSDPPKPDSWFPHVQALAVNPGFWKWVFRVVVPVVMGFLVKPSWDWIKAELLADHVEVVRLGQHIQYLETAQADAVKAELLAQRKALTHSTRQVVEYIAGARKQNVASILSDYDDLVKNWAEMSPKCLDPLQCPAPAEAADRVLAQHKR